MGSLRKQFRISPWIANMMRTMARNEHTTQTKIVEIALREHYERLYPATIEFSSGYKSLRKVDAKGLRWVIENEVGCEVGEKQLN